MTSRHRDDGPARGRLDPQAGVSRRRFVQGSLLGTAAFAVGARGGARAAEVEEIRPMPAGERTPIRLEINGRPHELLVEPRWSLLFVLREKLGLTASKAGCERGECGACTVLMDGIPRYACLTLAVEAGRVPIETSEGLTLGEAPGPVQASFIERDGLQCGYCTPGQVVAAEGLLRRNPTPSFEEIRTGMSGNLCRCGAYAHIFAAVADAADRRKGEAPPSRRAGDAK